MSGDLLGGIAAVLWILSGIAGSVAAGFGFCAWRAEREQSRARELKIEELKHDIMIRGLPRWAKLDMQKLEAPLKAASPGTVEIIFLPDNDEAHRTAMSIAMSLGVNKWKILGENEMPSPASPRRTDLILPMFANNPLPEIPIMTRMGLLSDITLIVSPKDASESTGFPAEGSAPRALLDGLHACGFQTISNFDPRLPSSSLRVLVGAKE